MIMEKPGKLPVEDLDHKSGLEQVFITNEADSIFDIWVHK
jgi:hypothetical protein